VCADVARTENTSSRVHRQQKQKQQYQESSNKDDDRSYFAKLLAMLQQKPKQQFKESTKVDDDRSFFEKFMDVLHHSASYRPPHTFFPIAVVVLLIYGGVSMVLGIWHLSRVARWV